MEVTLGSRARERSFGKMVNANDIDEELALFLEMRRRDKKKNNTPAFFFFLRARTPMSSTLRPAAAECSDRRRH
ncbi:hypothetical protein ACFX2C_040816 [Malus domestica]